MLGDPAYGCNLIERVFAYNGIIVEALIKEDIVNAISAYEPRIIVKYNDITIVSENRLVRIYIQYEIKETGQINQFNLDITAMDNPDRI